MRFADCHFLTPWELHLYDVLGRYLPVVALIAALFGFGGIAGTAMEAAKLVFFVAIVLFAISAVVGLMRGRAPRV